MSVKKKISKEDVLTYLKDKILEHYVPMSISNDDRTYIISILDSNIWYRFGIRRPEIDDIGENIPIFVDIKITNENIIGRIEKRYLYPLDLNGVFKIPLKDYTLVITAIDKFLDIH